MYIFSFYRFFIKHNGYIALSMILIIAAVVVALSTTVSLLAIGEAQSGFATTQGETSLDFTEGCMEDALLKMKFSASYAGGTISRPEGNCAVTLSKSGNVWTINVASNSAFYSRTIQAAVVKTSIATTSSWIELGSNNTPTPTSGAPTSTPTPTFTPTPTPTPALEANSTAQHTTASTVSWTHTVGSNSNRLLLVGISTYATGATSVTFGAQSMTKLTSATNGSQAYSEIWYLIGPNTGTNVTITVTLPSSVAVVAGSASFYNVPSSGTFGTAATATGNSGNPSTTNPATNPVTGTAGQLVFDNFSDPANLGSWSPTAQTQLWYDGTSNGGGSSYVAGPVSSVKWGNSSSNELWADVAVPIN